MFETNFCVGLRQRLCLLYCPSSMWEEGLCWFLGLYTLFLNVRLSVSPLLHVTRVSRFFICSTRATKGVKRQNSLKSPTKSSVLGVLS